MIALGIPWNGPREDGKIIAAIRDGLLPGEIERLYKRNPEQQLDVFLRYIDHVVSELSDRATAKQQRAIARDTVLQIIARYYEPAMALNLKAAQFVLTAISLYSRLERDHYEMDRTMMADENATSPDDRKPLSPEEASARRQAELDELERDGYHSSGLGRRARALLES